MGKCLFMRKGETHSAPLSGIKASDLAVGSSVYLNENGSPVEYLVVNHGIPSNSSLYDSSCNGTWLLRKYVPLENRQWHTTNQNSYKDSAIHSYLNNEFFNLFDTTAQKAIKQVKIPYHNGIATTGAIASGADGLSTRVFLLGCYEVGYTKNTVNNFVIDGACLNYFSDSTTAQNNRITRYEGMEETAWWLRTAHTGGYTHVKTVNYNGNCGYDQAKNLAAVRPALILPSNAIFDKNTLVLKGVA